jgi:hypothetical protein
MEERRQESPMELPQGKRGGGRKKESRKEKKGRGLFRRTSHANSFSVTESHHVRRCDLCMSDAPCSGMTESTWPGG